MDLYNKFQQARNINRRANNEKIKNALRGTMPKSADLVYDLSRGEKGQKVDNNRRAHLKAVELVSGLLDSFGLPVKPVLSYRGMIKNATDNTGVIEDGIIRLGATIQTLMGHKADIDIPVIIKNKTLIEPAIFLYQDAPYVMCGPALQEIIKRGTLQRQINPRQMYSPPTDQEVDLDNLPRETIVYKEHMFSPGPRNPYNFRRQYNKAAANERIKDNTDDPKFNQWLGIDKDKIAAKEPRKRTNIDTPAVFPDPERGEVPDNCLDPAERSREGLFEPGHLVKVVEDVQARDRGGGYLIVPKGEEGVVIKDKCGDGKILAIEFPALSITTALPKKYLKSASLRKVAQAGQPEYIDDTYLEVTTNRSFILVTGSASEEYSGGEAFYDNESGMFVPRKSSIADGELAERLNQEGYMVSVGADMIPVEVIWHKFGGKEAAVTTDQIQKEVKEMLREGYQAIDIREAINRRYPQHAEEALKGLG